MYSQRSLTIGIAIFCLVQGSVLAEPGFHPFSEKTMSAEVKRAFSSSVKMYVDGNHYCSATFVSPSGYLLTAAHCLEKCLSSKKMMHVSDDANFKIRKVINQLPRDVYCDDLKIPSLNLKRPKVIYVGYASSTFDDSKIVFISNDDFIRISDHYGGDFAIIKFETASQTSCTPISATDVQPSDSISLIGFPTENKRPNNKGSDGKSQLISFGKAYSTIGDSEYVKETKFDEKALARLRKIYDQPQILLSDVDWAIGESGGTILNAEGKLAGVYYGYALPDDEVAKIRYFAGSAVGVKIGFIKAELEKTAGKPFAAKIFACP